MSDKIEKHLADIAKSLKILSGRERLEELTQSRALVESGNAGRGETIQEFIKRINETTSDLGPSGDSPALTPSDAPSNGESWGQGDLG